MIDDNRGDLPDDGQQFIALLTRMFERMSQEDSFPWEKHKITQDGES